MKTIKRILTGIFSLVLVFGMGIMLTGCSGIKGNYDYLAMTFTIITGTETASDGKVIITETRELTSEEYFLYKEKHIALDKLASTKLQDSDKTAYEAWIGAIYPTMQNSKLSVSKNTLTFTERQTSVGGIEVDVITSANYTKLEEGYLAAFTSEVDGEITKATQIVYMNFTVDSSDNIHLEVKNEG